MMGSKIEYTSTISKGSSFWFSLELNESDLNYINYSFSSNVTEQGIYFNEQPIQNILNIGISTNCTSFITAEEQHNAKYSIIVVDDDIVIRQATIRLLSKTFKEKKLNVKILEASDGIECLSIYYNYLKDGRTISFILSDETMVYMNGIYASQILENISNQHNIPHVPFYILSAYENLSSGLVKETTDGIFTKPLRKSYIEEIINNLK
jgi:PleD family two-component response regulator